MKSAKTAPRLTRHVVQANIRGADLQQLAGRERAARRGSPVDRVWSENSNGRPAEVCYLKGGKPISNRMERTPRRRRFDTMQSKARVSVHSRVRHHLPPKRGR